MSVLVDTPVWSLALRRDRNRLNSSEQLVFEEWVSLVDRNEIVLIGPIRQELLSGIRSEKTFATLRDRLDEFPDLPLQAEHYVRAAEFYNVCRSRGVTGAPVDLLLCAAAFEYDVPIFTIDSDFTHFRRVLPIRFHSIHLP